MRKNLSLFEKVIIGLLLLLNVLFLIYWIGLSVNYCLHFDDVDFLCHMRDYSIYQFVHEMYMTRGGNFITYGLDAIIFLISNWIGAYRFWPMIFYVIGIIITWEVFKNWSWISKSGFKGWLGVITLYNVYILTSIDYAVFTWICAAIYYLYAPLVCAILYFLHQEKLYWWQWILLLVASISIAGLSVSISTVTFVVLFVYGMYMWYKEGWDISNTWKKPQVRRLLCITVLMLICFAIVFVAPGNWDRMAEEFDIEQPQNLIEFLKAIAICAGMFLYMMVFYLPYHLIAAALGAWAGEKYPVSLPIGRNKTILLILLIFVIYLLISVVPLAYLSNGFQIQRNYIQIGFFYILTFFMVGYVWASYDNQKNIKHVNSLLIICSLFLIVIMCLNIRQDLPVAHAYNIAHQERESYLLELQKKGNIETVEVTPYPSTHTSDSKHNVLKLIGKESPKQAIYYESDTGVKPNGYERHIRELYGLDFDFVLEEPKK